MLGSGSSLFGCCVFCVGVQPLFVGVDVLCGRGYGGYLMLTFPILAHYFWVKPAWFVGSSGQPMDCDGLLRRWKGVRLCCGVFRCAGLEVVSSISLILVL